MTLLDTSIIISMIYLFRKGTLDTGAYELSIIAEQLSEWIEINHPDLKNVTENFKLVGNEATSKAEFLFKDDYGIDFNVEYSIHYWPKESTLFYFSI